MEKLIQHNVSLKPFNTFGIEVFAEKFASFSTLDELDMILQDEEADGEELFVLGGGSNILFTKNQKGLVLRNELKGISITKEEGDNVWIEAAAGEVWHKLVLQSIEEGLAGIENLSLIPGCVGAAPMQNIGAYGVEIKDVFEELEAYEIATGKLRTFNNEECEFGYRESIFKRALKGKYIILSITLKLSRKAVLNTSYGAIENELKASGIERPTIKDVSDAVIKIRQSKLPDPAEIGNSGSFFKNPVISWEQFEKLQEEYPNIANYPIDENQVKIAAGWLIDQAGWKGKTLGNYGVHKNQALVLVNYGGASGADIYDLSEEILQSIHKKYGIQLEREVNIL